MGDKLAVGIDFGGTKILAGVVNLETGALVGTSKKKTRAAHEQDDLIKRIISVVDDALSECGVDQKKLAGIGIGAAGMVNRQKGILLHAVNLGLNELPLTAPLADHYGVPARLGNDVEVATLGELVFGAGRNCNDFICIFVGTGIGSGIVCDGKQYHGATGTAGEIGHIVLEPNGRPCNCGGLGCLEAYASRTAIAKQILSDIARGMDTTIADKIDMDKGILRAKALSNAFEQGDEVVTRAVQSAARYMGSGLATVVNLLNPKRIILGGGLVEALDAYYQLAQKEARFQSLKIATRKLEIVKAELGDYAGIIGAALLSTKNGKN
jgi:glucokinase